MKKTENLNFKSKFTLMSSNVCNQNEIFRLINKNGDKSEKYQMNDKNSKTILNSNIIDRSYIYEDNTKTGLSGYQSTKTDKLNKTLVNCNIQRTKVTSRRNKSIVNNPKNNYFETYVPEKYGLNYNNTFVMSFCQPSLYNYFKCLIGLNSHEYDDYIQYKLYRKFYNKQDILIKTVIVEKNAFHCQGLVKKIKVMKDYNHVPKKIIFV